MRCCTDIFLILFATLLLAGCGKQAAGPLDLVFTSDMGGRLEPCGCFAHQLGGLSRVGGWLSFHRLHRTIKVDLGGALRGDEEHDLLQYPHMQEAFAKLGFDLLNLGVPESGVDVQRLKAWVDGSPVPVIGANLENEQGEALAPPFTVIQQGALKVSFLGVVDENLVKKTGQGVVVRPMFEVISKHLEASRSAGDVLVLCAATDEEGAARLQDRFAEVDLILAGAVRQPSQEIQQRRHTYYAGISGEGKNVGYLKANVAEGGIREVEKMEVQLLTPFFSKDPAVLKVQEEYRSEVAETDLLIDGEGQWGNIPGVESESRYVGSQACMGCHQEAYRIWQQTPHAVAHETLVKDTAHMDPQCLACHTVGLGQPSGFRRKDPQAHLKGVGCESCHGPGEAHLIARASGKKSLYRMRPIGETECLQCHQGEFSRPFNWEQWWPHIAHGREQR